MRLFWLIILFVLFSLGLAACGNQGALYLPDSAGQGQQKRVQQPVDNASHAMTSSVKE